MIYLRSQQCQLAPRCVIESQLIVYVSLKYYYFWDSLGLLGLSPVAQLAPIGFELLRAFWLFHYWAYPEFSHILSHVGSSCPMHTAASAYHPAQERWLFLVEEGSERIGFTIRPVDCPWTILISFDLQQHLSYRMLWQNMTDTNIVLSSNRSTVKLTVEINL